MGIKLSMTRHFLMILCCVSVALISLHAHAQEADATPAAPAASASPAASSAPAPSTPGDKAANQYEIKLRELEERVGALKEKIYRSKTRLVLLREQILHNVIAEAKAILVHRNNMGALFTLEQILYFLDGNKVYYHDNKTGLLDERREFEIFNGNVMPGNHIVSVEMVYRGSGGIFSYVDGYLFKIKSNYTFYASKGRITRVAIIGHERGGLTTTLEDKPYVSYEVQQFRYNKENLARLTEGEEAE
jgi:hypothetical protein